MNIYMKIAGCTATHMAMKNTAITGTITATATAVHLGRSSTVHTVEIRDEADRLISIARVANRILVRSTHG